MGNVWKVDLLNGASVWMADADVQNLDTARALAPYEQRQHILRSASFLIGHPYYWGGRSPHSPQTPPMSSKVTGMDCSGLVNLAYRSVGIELPRDAHEQFLRAKPRTRPESADLIFLSERSNSTRIVHVMLYAGAGQIIEAPATGGTVRQISAQERLKQPIEQLHAGSIVDGQTVLFGSYLP